MAHPLMWRSPYSALLEEHSKRNKETFQEKTPRWCLISDSFCFTKEKANQLKKFTKGKGHPPSDMKRYGHKSTAALKYTGKPV